MEDKSYAKGQDDKKQESDRAPHNDPERAAELVLYGDSKSHRDDEDRYCEDRAPDH